MAVTLAHSSFIDLAGYRVTNATTAPAAYGFDDSQPAASNQGINVAIVLPRANDPTTLLAGDWASRQQTLQKLNADGTLWTTYGTDKAIFDATKAFLTDNLGLKVLDGTNSNYVTSAESRTIWLEISKPSDFQKLFNTELLYSKSTDLLFWNGKLAVPEQLKIAGLWFDTSTLPPGSNLAPGASVTLPAGPQSLGNSAPVRESHNLAPQDMAAQYNFPLNGEAVQTKAVGLLEPGVGSALPDDLPGAKFQAKLTDYLRDIGRHGDGVVLVQGANGQIYDISAGERSLDVSVVAGVNPNSDIVLFNGSGLTQRNAQATTYTAIQSATFPGTGEKHVVAWSDSFGDAQSMSPDSPFYRAYWELYVDTALANQTAVTALGDGGSSQEIGNGLTNLEYNCTQPYSLLVGGSSLSLLSAAASDPTLANAVLAPAMAGDMATIWQLVMGGLTALPANMRNNQFFAETAWNYYTVHDQRIEGSAFFSGGGYLSNTATNGGVDPTQPVPSYQVAYGLNPTTSDPLAEVGRGAPDVTANAGGNATYRLANDDMSFSNGYYIGTSAASPLWASLIVQIDTIFDDQGLPDLGYAHDLLYMASAIAPASFNDLTMGNNISSWVFGGPYRSNDADITPTGFGYYAGPGYDLVSGLGSPNGTVLARTLSAAAHAQMYFSDVPDTIVGDETTGWTSGTAQSLLFQTMSGRGVIVDMTVGSAGFEYASGPSDTYAWTSRLAMQSLRPDFDPALVRLFDKQSQGVETQRFVAAGQALDVSIGGQDAQAIQAGLSSAFGFADFVSSEGVVRVARPVAVAETAGGQDDQQAVVRVRQNGEDSLTMTFYKVDDYAGTIDGLQPGAAGYAVAAQGRVYQLALAGSTGNTLAGPGYGNYMQAMLQNVDAGDLVAMKLTDITKGFTYWAFAQANEMVNGQPVGHIWNYGLNTWGWEDTQGGGDRDYNDLVVQLDFTSASGHGWLV